MIVGVIVVFLMGLGCSFTQEIATSNTDQEITSTESTLSDVGTTCTPNMSCFSKETHFNQSNMSPNSTTPTTFTTKNDTPMNKHDSSILKFPPLTSNPHFSQTEGDLCICNLKVC